MSYLIKQNKHKDVKLVHVAIGNEISALAAGRADVITSQRLGFAVASAAKAAT